MNNNFSKTIKNNKFIMVFSLLAAFVFWFTLTATSIQQVSIKKDVDISWDAAVQSMQQNYENFKVITVNGEKPELFKSVSVTITGTPSSVTDISNSDISITPDLTVFTAPDTKTVTLSSQIINSTFANSNITNVYPNQVEVRVDKYVEMAEFAVVAQYSGLSLKENLQDTFVLGTAALKNAESNIFISGPMTEIESIATVVCVADFGGAEIDTTAVGAGKILLLDKNGEKISQELLTLSYSEAEITVPIFSKKTVNVLPKFINGPAKFNNEYSVDVESLTLRGPDEILATLENIYTKDIDISVLEVGKEHTIEAELNLPAGVSVIEGQNKVNVKIDLTEIESKTLYVGKVIFDNIKGSTASLIQSNVPVNIAGPKKVIDDVTANNILIRIDMSNQTATGNIEVPLVITVNDFDSVYVLNNPSAPYTAEIKVS